MVDVSDRYPACALVAGAFPDTRMVGRAARIDGTGWRLARGARSTWRARNDLGGRCAARALEGARRLFQAAGHTNVDGGVPPYRLRATRLPWVSDCLRGTGGWILDRYNLAGYTDDLTRCWCCSKRLHHTKRRVYKLCGWIALPCRRSSARGPLDNIDVVGHTSLGVSP